MVVVGYQWFRAVQQGSEYDDLIGTDLSALLQMLFVPYSFVGSAKSTTCLSQSVVYFPVNLGVCDGTPPDKRTDELLSAQFHWWWYGAGSTLLGIQAGEGPQSFSSGPPVQRAGQPLQSILVYIYKHTHTHIYMCIYAMYIYFLYTHV